jgi:hypothetical protein
MLPRMNLRRRRALPLILAVAAALLGLFASGCGESEDAGAEPSETSTVDLPSLPSGQTGAVLAPVGEIEASGTALVLRSKPGAPARFKVRVEGLEPSKNGGQYVVWLTTERHDMVPLYSYPVGKTGVFDHEWKPNPLHVGFIEEGKKDKFVMTLAKTGDEHEDTLEGGSTAYDPPFIGQPVLEGDIAGPLADSKSSG